MRTLWTFATWNKEVALRKRRSTILLVAFFALSVFAIQAYSMTPLQLRTLKGVWTCPICDAKGIKGAYETCEALGHKHVLKLNDGTLVTFADNVRGEALTKGGGRHHVPITVVGFYDPSAHTIDVDTYKIDGQWSSWCDKHERMDFCRSGSPASPPQAENETAR